MDRRMLEHDKSQLRHLLLRQAVQEGFSPAPLDGVQYLLATHPYPRAPAVYEPSIIILAQGRKRGYVGNHRYIFDAFNYLVLSVPLPLECETEASAEEPLLGVSIKVDPAMLSELVLQMAPQEPNSEAGRSAIYAAPLRESLIDAAVRLLQCLETPQDCKILGPQIVREIVYRVLCEEPSGALKAVIAPKGKTIQISRILNRIHVEYPDCHLSVEKLAQEAHMSLSAFHHTFKAVTLTSPLQYLKSVRLHKAKMLMLTEGVSARMASDMVGYSSEAHFNREFKRFFGASPAKEIARLRTT